MQKSINIEGLDSPVVFARRKGTRSLRLSVKSDGVIRVGVPYGVPEFMAKKFVEGKVEWIKTHLKPQLSITNETHIGKNHRVIIKYVDSTRPSTKITDTEVRINLPYSISADSVKGQKIIKSACEKALIKESEILLLQRLEFLSIKHDIRYTSGSIKKLKSRWGACDSLNNIHLNCYLIQLDWHLIDYVICHELAHTLHHHHQASFWDYLSTIFPDYKNAKKEIKTKSTDII